MGARKEDERQPMTFAPGCEVVEKYIFLISNDSQKRDSVKVFWIIVCDYVTALKTTPTSPVLQDHFSPTAMLFQLFVFIYIRL